MPRSRAPQRTCLHTAGWASAIGEDAHAAGDGQVEAGCLGAFQTIIKEEGCVKALQHACAGVPDAVYPAEWAACTAASSPHSSWRHLSVPSSCTFFTSSVAHPLPPTCAPPSRAALVNSASVSTQRGERLLGQAVPRAHRAEENRPATRDCHGLRGGCDRELRRRTIRTGQNQVRGDILSVVCIRVNVLHAGLYAGMEATMWRCV